MALTLRATTIEHVADADPSVRWDGPWLEVVSSLPHRPGYLLDRCHADFRMMCDAIMSDIQTAEGSGATALEEIRRIEAGEVDLIEADGNAWVAHITRGKVWFEGLYSQGEGGAVSFAQYKLAVETYVRFLADPQRQPIEVIWPSA
jgi:hypothetical protein